MCFQCIRLGKDCQYPQGPKPTEGEELDRESLIARVQLLEDRLDSGGLGFVEDPGAERDPPLRSPPLFPSALFLDPEFLSPLPQTPLAPSRAVSLGIRTLIGTDIGSVCRHYFSTTHTWFPFVSQKRTYHLLDGTIDDSLALLLVCMKLVSKHSMLGIPANDVLYKTAKHLFLTLESTTVTSVLILQSLVLIALYELGHGIFPAAYLTIGHAARLGIMMGLHCRNPHKASQLYKPATSWTPREEERRVWWAILILDR